MWGKSKAPAGGGQGKVSGKRRARELEGKEAYQEGEEPAQEAGEDAEVGFLGILDEGDISIYLSIYLPIYLIYLSVYLSNYLSIYLSISLVSRILSGSHVP